MQDFLRRAQESNVWLESYSFAHVVDLAFHPSIESEREPLTNEIDISACQEIGQQEPLFLPTSAEYLHDPITYHGRLDELETRVVELCLPTITLMETKVQEQHMIVVSNSPTVTPLAEPTIAISSFVVDIIIATSRVVVAITEAFTCLQDSDFCGTEFNIVVLHPDIPRTLKIVPIGEELLSYLAEITDDSMDLVQARVYEAVDLETCLEKWTFTATHILEYLGLGVQNCQSLETGCSHFLCLMQMLSFGLMS